MRLTNNHHNLLIAVGCLSALKNGQPYLGEDIEHHQHTGNKSNNEKKFIVDFLFSKSSAGYLQQTSPYYYDLTYTLPDFRTGSSTIFDKQNYAMRLSDGRQIQW